MTILKKKKYIRLSITETTDVWKGNSEKDLLKPTKVALVRMPISCNIKCVFSSICSFWGPKYILHGLIMSLKKSTEHSYYIQLCDCGNKVSSKKFSYIFTYETLRKSISFQILKEMGLVSDPPKKTGKLLPTFDRPTKYYNPKTTGRTNSVPRRNYNARKR